MLSGNHTNVSEHFPKFSENFRRLPRKIRRCFDLISINLGPLSIVTGKLCELIGNYGLETVVSVLFTNTRTRWPHNEREIFNTLQYARGVAECSIENFEFIVLSASACICKQNTN